MEIGTEISQKIRSAIKAKLIELGAYVDDELPDYIMVMVANKKSQKQMTEDLSLFLSTNTEKFTTWLHGLLKKLQSINTETTNTKHKSKDKPKEKKKRKSSTGDKDKTEDKAESTSKVRKTSTSDKEKRKSLDEKKGVGASGKQVAPAVVAATTPASTAAPTPPTAVVGEVDQSDEIRISENTDEFTEEAKELAKKESKQSAGSAKPPSKTGKSDKSSDLKDGGARRSSHKEHSHSHSQTKHKAHSSTASGKVKSTTDEGGRKPTSFVASVKRKYEEEPEEEYDPLNPAVGSVASVVKGPTRKSSVPANLQANKSLLMKAVNEAEKSVHTQKKTDHVPEPPRGVMRSDQQPVDSRRRLKTAAGLQLMSRSKRKDLETLHYTVDNKQPQTSPRKTVKPSSSFENIKYTVKNEAVKSAKVASVKKAKTSASAAPSRVATSALRGLSKVTPVESTESGETADGNQITAQESGEESDEDDQGSVGDSGDSGSDMSRESSDADGQTESLSDDEEIEIDIVDRAAQTHVNMRENNFHLCAAKLQGVDRDTQTEADAFVSVGSDGQKLSREKLREIDDSLLNLFIENMLPFTFVENDHFKLFAKTLEPKYHFPKRKKLVTEVGLLYNTVKAKLKEELAAAESIVFLNEVWLSDEKNMYYTVSACFINGDWKLRSVCLKCSSISESVEDVSALLVDTRTKWSLPEPALVSGDFDLGVAICEQLGWTKVPCFGCGIKSVIQFCLNMSDVQRLLLKGRKLVKELNNGAVHSLFEKKKKLLLPPEVQSRQLVLDDDLTWTSVQDMLSALIEQSPAIHAAVMDTELISKGVDLRNLMYTFIEQAFVEALLKILNVFRTAVEILTKTDGPTLQKVVPTFVKLDKALEIDADTKGAVKDIKSNMKQRTEELLEADRAICLLACLLHPQTKQMAFVSQKEKAYVKELLFSKIETQCKEEYLNHKKTNEVFKKSKVTSERQTKAMSVKVEETDIRKVVVNTAEESGEKDDASTDGSHDDDCRDEQASHVDVNINPDADNDVKRYHGGHRTDSNSRNSGQRNVQRTTLTESNITNLSITVENDWLDDVIGASDEQQSPEETAKIELNLYMAEPASNKSPLQWWKEKCPLYPHVSKIAKQVLAIPASSVTAEDVFSLDSAHKVRHIDVKPEHVDMLMFLKRNKYLCEVEDCEDR